MRCSSHIKPTLFSLTIIIILSVQFNSVTYIHVAVQGSPELFHLAKVKLSPLNSNSQSLRPGNRHSQCLYEFDGCKYLI